jgi:hypothetical protein
MSLWDGFLTVELLPEWHRFEEEGVLSIYRRDGVGVLQFAFANASDASLADVELQTADFARDVQLDAAVQRTRFGGCEAAYVEGPANDAERSFWRAWFALRPDRIVFATYRCTVDDSGLERDEVDRILATARFA